MATHNVGELVHRQALRWDLQRRAAAGTRKPACIALSRFPGSGGAELGQRVADALDYGFFGIEIVDGVARGRRIERRLVADLDEHVRSTIDRYVVDAFRTRPFRESDYLREVVRAVTSIAEQGMAVILGRGAPFVLRPERTLRVLVVAPRRARIERLAKERDLPVDEAERRMRREDEERRTFLTQFGVDPDDPSIYDLVVNTGSLGMDGATHTVVQTFRDRHPGA